MQNITEALQYIYKALKGKNGLLKQRLLDPQQRRFDIVVEPDFEKI